MNSLYWPLFVQPTGEGGATRAPICIDLKRDDSLSSKSIILQVDDKSQPVSASESSYDTQVNCLYITIESHEHKFSFEFVD